MHRLGFSVVDYCITDFCQQCDIFGWFFFGMFATHFDDFVHRHNDGEVDGCCDEQEVDDSCQQYAKGNFIAVECDLCELIKVWRTYKCRDERHKHGVGQKI